jgi:Anti-sigma-K factor rskA
MTDDADIDATDDLPEEIADVLARADTWADLPAGLEDAVVAAIAAEAGGLGRSDTSAVPADVALAPAVSINAARTRRAGDPAVPAITERRSAMPWWLTAAAAVAVLITGVVLVTRAGDDGGSGGAEFAMAGTELAPGATASAVFDVTPDGLQIMLDTTDLPGAPEGQMYEAWIGNGDIRVSAGTFHLRGGGAPISLWAGTADPSFTIITVTIEPIDGDAASSGNVVLRGEFDMPATDTD